MGECVIIRVKRSAYGFFMYLLDLLAIIFIGFYLAGPEVFLGMGNGIIAILIFLMIGLSLVMAYVDLGKTTEKARERLSQMRIPRTEMKS